MFIRAIISTNVFYNCLIWKYISSSIWPFNTTLNFSNTSFYSTTYSFLSISWILPSLVVIKFTYLSKCLRISSIDGLKRAIVSLTTQIDSDQSPSTYLTTAAGCLRQHSRGRRSQVKGIMEITLRVAIASGSVIDGANLPNKWPSNRPSCTVALFAYAGIGPNHTLGALMSIADWFIRRTCDALVFCWVIQLFFTWWSMLMFFLFTFVSKAMLYKTVYVFAALSDTRTRSGMLA